MFPYIKVKGKILSACANILLWKFSADYYSQMYIDNFILMMWLYIGFGLVFMFTTDQELVTFIVMGAQD